MNTSSIQRWLAAIIFTAVLGAVGCDADSSARQDKGSDPKDVTRTAEPKRKELFKNIILETQGDVRRVLVKAEVCMREGGNLEELLCRKGTKEHESILTADVNAQHLHAALVVAGGKEGSPVKFEPKYQAARGSTIKISLQYEEKGKLITVSAKDWIRNPKTKKNLDVDWVFGGSQLVPNPDDKTKPLYLANYGDIICLCNMESAMLDLPIESPKKFDDRLWECHTERIPPLETKVTIILEPVPDKK